jgi:hypothetical protein
VSQPTGQSLKLGSEGGGMHACEGGALAVPPPPRGCQAQRSGKPLNGTIRQASRPDFLSNYNERNPAPLDPRKHRKIAFRCVCVGEDGDGEVVQL